MPKITQGREIACPTQMRPREPAARSDKAADLAERCGGIMRIGRTVIIPVILALGVAGSVLASAEVSAAVVRTPSAHVQQATSTSARPLMRYHD
jgi:hypothetical protein